MIKTWVDFVKPSTRFRSALRPVRASPIDVSLRKRPSRPKALWPLVALLLLLAVGCGSSSSPTLETTTPTPLPTVEADPSPTITFTVPAVESPAPTSTVPPSPVPSPTATPTPTLIPEAGPTPLSIPKPLKRDLYELARALSLKTIDPIPRITYDTTRDLQEGHRDTFNVLDSDAVKSEKVVAILKLVSHNAYWYIQDGLDISREELEEAALAFEGDIYPVVTEAFGPLWPPQAAAGQRITILHARLRGAAGYYSSVDEYPTAVHQHSNQRKMIYINSSFLRTGSSSYLSTLGHELQHAIHWNLNRGQSTWLNEGLSQVAEQRLGYPLATVDSFTTTPLTSLVYWPIDGSSNIANYGAAFLFTHFLDSHYVPEGDLRPLVKTGGVAGIDSVNAYLALLNAGEDFDAVFGRWIVANYLGQMDSGPFSYPGLKVGVDHTDVLGSEGAFALSQPQYSARYVLLDLEGSQAEVGFVGGAHTPLIPVDPLQGGHCWWSNRGDSMSTALTREFDLSTLDRATLRFSLWYEIEEGWDYGYVQVSTDGGLTWDILEGDLATARNPVGNSFGPGYSGFSVGWVEDQVDLTPYAGRKVLVRFHYVTDDAINGTGLCLDTISVPQIGFFDDASQDQVWLAEGFFRTNNRVPQGYAVWVIETRDGDRSVRPLELDDSNEAQALVTDLDLLDEVVLVVGSLARGSNLPTQYQLTLKAAWK